MGGFRRIFPTIPLWFSMSRRRYHQKNQYSPAEARSWLSQAFSVRVRVALECIELGRSDMTVVATGAADELPAKIRDR